MRYSLLVALREYLEHTKTKGFWIGIAMVPVLLLASIKIPVLLDEFARQTRYFAVVDASNNLGPAIDTAIREHYAKKRGAAFLQWQAQKLLNASAPDFVDPRPWFVRVPLPADITAASGEGSLTEACKPYLLGKQHLQVEGREEDLFALIVLPREESALQKGVEYWSTNLADDDLQDVVARGLQSELHKREFDRSGIDRAVIERINKIEVDLARRDPKKEAGKEAVGDIERIRQWAPIGFVYILFIAIMNVSQMLLSSTIEEKSNRIVEVLLSSVTPSELMLGKLLGVAGIGITMLAAWFAFGAGVLSYYSAAGVSTVGALKTVLISPGLLGPFVVYFLLGYLFYASILLALGSVCNTLKDAQNFMGPVMMVLMVPLLTMVFVAKDPNGPLAVVLSWIPFFTPFVMMNRAAAEPPLVQVVGTMAMLVGSLVLVVWLSGRIFRNGILRTGQPPKLFEILKFARK